MWFPETKPVSLFKKKLKEVEAKQNTNGLFSQSLIIYYNLIIRSQFNTVKRAKLTFRAQHENSAGKIWYLTVVNTH